MNMAITRAQVPLAAVWRYQSRLLLFLHMSTPFNYHSQISTSNAEVIISQFPNHLHQIPKFIEKPREFIEKNNPSSVSSVIFRIRCNLAGASEMCERGLDPIRFALYHCAKSI